MSAAKKFVKKAADPISVMTLGAASSSDLDPTYRKGAVGGKLLGGEASLEAEAAAREGADLQSIAQMEALAAIKDAGAQATTTLDPLAQQGMAARSQQEALLGLGGDSQAAYDAVLNSPQFLAQQASANRALERKAGAYGNLISGGTLAGLSEQNNILAGQAINNQLNQLGQYSQAGINAISQTAGIQQGIGQSAAQAITGAAQAQAQGAANAAAARGAYDQGLMNLAGQVGSAYMMCDIRLKENIKEIGKIKGYNLYSFNYIGDNLECYGPMAQEVETINPKAVTMVNGFKAVNMEAL